MTQLPADGAARLAVQHPLLGAESLGRRTTCGRGLPTGQLRVAILRVLMPEPRELGESGLGGMALIDA